MNCPSSLTTSTLGRGSVAVLIHNRLTLIQAAFHITQMHQSQLYRTILTSEIRGMFLFVIKKFNLTAPKYLTNLKYP
jgi:hypothetical protein